MVPDSLRFVLSMNPMAYFVGIYRQCVLGSGAPALGDFVIAAAFSIAMFVAGGFVFRRLRRGFADVL